MKCSDLSAPKFGYATLVQKILQRQTHDSSVEKSTSATETLPSSPVAAVLLEQIAIVGTHALKQKFEKAVKVCFKKYCTV